MARKGLNKLDKQFAKFTDADGDAIVVKAQNAAEWKGVPTDSPAINAAFGKFLPLGAVITIGGKESSAKTAVMMNILGSVQRNIASSGKLDADGDPVTSGVVGLWDAERSYDSKWAMRLGLDVGLKDDGKGNLVPNGSDNFRLIQTSEAEPALDALEAAVGSGEYDCILLDSVNALNPLADSIGNTEMDQQSMALQARLMSRHLRRIKNLARKRECTIIYISQVRNNMDKYQTFIDSLASGNALKFYSEIVIQCSRTEFIGDKDSPDGIVSKIVCKKNKVAKPGRSASFSLYYEGPQGFDYDMDYVDTAVALTEESSESETPISLIKKGGAWFTLLDAKGDPIKVGEKEKTQGKKSFLEALKAMDYIPTLKTRIERAQQGLPEEELLKD